MPKDRPWWNRSSGIIRLIIVDDEAQFLETAQISILREGCGVEVVGAYLSARAALQDVHEVAPDVALVDVQMPDMDGITCARKIKQRSPGTAIIFVTGKPLPENFPEAFSFGPCGFIAKPFEVDDLRLAIDSAAHGMFVLSATPMMALRTPPGGSA